MLPKVKTWETWNQVRQKSQICWLRHDCSETWLPRDGRYLRFKSCAWVIVEFQTRTWVLWEQKHSRVMFVVRLCVWHDLRLAMIVWDLGQTLVTKTGLGTKLWLHKFETWFIKRFITFEVTDLRVDWRLSWTRLETRTSNRLDLTWATTRKLHALFSRTRDLKFW